MIGEDMKGCLLGGAALWFLSASWAQVPAVAQDGLLFYASADHTLVADVARGKPAPTFADHVRLVPDGARGAAIHADDDEVLAWSAPGNIYAQRGTLSFFWRARDPAGRNAFPIFRVGYADHSSWDMVWLRLDWNGHGFDAFVTDTGLSRVRVSYTLDKPLRPDQWVHLAFAWDEASGVALYVDGKRVAEKRQPAVLDAGLDQFGPFARIISPQMVQSRYNFMRGGDIDEIRIYDQALDAPAVAALANNKVPSIEAYAKTMGAAWDKRFGFDQKNGDALYLKEPSTAIRKVQFTDARDLKARMAGGIDGIRETTWPGVYNRSRLPGRHDYFELPDWNVYVEGGQSYTLSLPGERWNRLEINGPAYGRLNYMTSAGEGAVLGDRPQGVERTTHVFAEHTGGTIRFDNAKQETPIEEIGAYLVTPGAAPAGTASLTYTVQPAASLVYPALDELSSYIDGRFPPAERNTVAALPAGAPVVARAVPAAESPIVHILVPNDLRALRDGAPLTQFVYGWNFIDAGLNGIELTIPAMDVQPTENGTLPLNIRIKDPLWPDRDLLDVNVAVKPHEARTLWLDTRDRILPDGRSLAISIAAPGGGFGPAVLAGAKVRLVFEDRTAALKEHLADREQEIRDQAAWDVEEHPVDLRLAHVRRFSLEVQDVLRVDPGNATARMYWAEFNPKQPQIAVTMPSAPKGVPLWAFRQVEDLKQVKKFVSWWIDNRQVSYGDFGGGISDDDDLTQQWPGLALMGVMPDKIRHSLDALTHAVDKNQMITNGLGTIRADELHSYEEGINARSEDVYVNFGDPEALERLMETARAYGRLYQTNPAGHLHIVSSYFSGTDVVREDPWQWQKPHSNLILHPGVLLLDYNDNPEMKKLILGVADGYLAHGQKDANGVWSYPEEIHWPDDVARGSLTASRDITSPMQIFWMAYRWSGDAKYLQPIYTRVAARGFDVLAAINDNLMDMVKKRAEWAPQLKANADKVGASSFDLYAGWQATGDKRYLESLYGHEIETALRRMTMVTQGGWWTDRVEIFSDQLQRSRMGGMALRRNQIVQGNTVSWRFAKDGDAENVAILMPNAVPTKFKVVAYNLANRPVSATMTGWHVAPGQWKMSCGRDANGDDRIDGTATPKIVGFERSVGLPLTFKPHVTTVCEFELDKRLTGIRDRADLAFGLDDVHVGNGEIAVTIHNLGSRPSEPGTITLEDAAGKTIAHASVPVIAAPVDLFPKTAGVRIVLPAGTKFSGARIRLTQSGDRPEITQTNNTVVLP
jgi:hypothetical protein